MTIDAIFTILVIYFFLHMFFVSMFDDHSHLSYSFHVGKIYGFKAFFVALYYSYILDNRYMKLSMTLPKVPSYKTVSLIELVCRRVLNGDKDCKIKFNSESIEVQFNGKLAVLEFNKTLGVILPGWNSNIILHPRTIKLIESCKPVDKRVDSYNTK